MEFDFEEIRCYKNEEVHDALMRLSEEKAFMKVLTTIYPLLPKDVIKQRLAGYFTNYDFQQAMVYPFLQNLEANVTKGVHLNGLDKIDRSEAYLYISNHRDIIMDSAFLSGKLIENKMDTVEIAIGDNLLIYPWIKDLVRVNKTFIVNRGLSARSILESSKKLSAYIEHTIKDKKQSIWLAQREGRAKDSNDRTQISLLKMLNMNGGSDFITNMINLNICPLSISYEYDPCDYLKAKEFQQKRDNPDFKKAPGDDLLNMSTGVMGYKGKVVFELNGTMNRQLEIIAGQTSDKNEQMLMVAELIDRQIHSNYTTFNVNKIAYDIVKDDFRFENEYTVEEKNEFEKYLKHQIDKIDIENKDQVFLRKMLLVMYANPLINKLATYPDLSFDGD